MKIRTLQRDVVWLTAALLFCLALSSGDVIAQRKPPSLREFLLQYKGREVLMMDKTGGVEQFSGGEAAKAYTVRLDDILNDYFVVTRDSDTDKRSFVYPISVVRRVIFLYDGKPYQKIVLEMY
jgi:hypothetical protein